MNDPKISVINYSTTGTIAEIATRMAKVAESAQLKQFIDSLGPQWPEGLLPGIRSTA